jgi:transcription initiation factor TFIIH subunit 2
MNALDLASATFNRTVPTYGRKEILVVYSSLITCDPGDIFTSFDKLKELQISASAISLTAELHVLKQLCNISKNGQFILAKDREHFSESVDLFLVPTESSNN